MKLSSVPKPVKFRIVSGGEEHSSLDSLRRNFCISDILKIEMQVIQWLNRQGSEGENIAKNLNIQNLNSAEDFLEVYKLFLPKELNGIETPIQLLEYLYQKGNVSDSSFLAKLGFEKDDGITIFCYTHRDSFSGLTDDWYVVLKNVRNKTEEVKEWIKQEKQKSEIKGADLNRLRVYLSHDWGSSIKYDRSSFTDTEKTILEFADACSRIANDIVRQYLGNIARLFGGHESAHFKETEDLARQCFKMDALQSYKNKFDLERKKDFMFDAKYFVLFMIHSKIFPHIINGEWIKEFFEGLSQKQKEITRNYDANEDELANLIKRFATKDLLKFLELE